jgi:rhodanese-related sulfurtransferase
MINVGQSLWQDKLAEDQNAVLLDVRTPDECSEGIQEGAIQLNILEMNTFLEGLESMDKSKNYYVYCRSGKRSVKACETMEVRGFNTFNLLGGMIEWTGKTVQP